MAECIERHSVKLRGVRLRAPMTRLDAEWLWSKGAPGVVARAYHRVKCVRSCVMKRSSCRFFAMRHSHLRQKLHQSFALAKPCRTTEQFFMTLMGIYMILVHAAFISLNTG